MECPCAGPSTRVCRIIRSSVPWSSSPSSGGEPFFGMISLYSHRSSTTRRKCPRVIFLWPDKMSARGWSAAIGKISEGRDTSLFTRHDPFTSPPFTGFHQRPMGLEETPHPPPCGPPSPQGRGIELREPSPRGRGGTARRWVRGLFAGVACITRGVWDNGTLTEPPSMHLPP